jgi:Carboxypeptidase regulatory-like domain
VNAAAARLGFESVGLTSSSGTYKIVGLRTGSYHIEIYPSCAGAAVNLPSATLRHAVRVTQGTVKRGVNASLHAGGSIAGLVTGPGAEAVPGACVEAYQIPGGQVSMSATNARGKYLVTGLTPGRYKVEFGDPSCSDGAPGLGTQWYDGAAGSGSATVLTVKPGRIVSAINGALPADGAITGSVTGTSAVALSGVCVSAVPVANGEPATFIVSAAEPYTLADLLPGRYRVEFQAGCGQAGVKTQWWQDAGSSASATTITLNPSETFSGVDAVMTSS